MITVLFTACTSTAPVDLTDTTIPTDTHSDPSSDLTVTETEGVFTVESKGMDDYVALIQNPETKGAYVSEAAPEDYEISKFHNGEIADFSGVEGANVYMYTEPNPNPDEAFSGLNLIFYLKEVTKDGSETWYGPFQGLMQ